MLKRIVALMLASLSILSMAACAAEKPAEETAVPDTTAPITETLPEETTHAETELTDRLPEVKMNGFEFRVYSSNTSGYCVNDPEEEIGEEINDSIFHRNLKLEERFGFTLTINGEPKDLAIVGNTLKNCSLAGDNAYQLYLPYTKTLIDYAQYLTPINNLKYVDYSRPWWFPDASASFCFDGVQLALSGCFDLTMPSKAQCIAFNKELAAELNLPKNLYQLVDDGEWTLDKYIEIGNMAARDLNGDGAVDQYDRFAIAGHWKAYYSPLVAAMGVNFAAKDEQGYPVFGGGSDEALVEALMRLKDMANNNPRLYRNTSTSQTQHLGGGAFASSTTFFISTEISSVAGSLRDLNFEIGVIPMPKGSVEQKDYYSRTAYGHSPAVCNALPKDQWEYVGILMEAFAFNTYTEILPVYKERTLKTKTASDVESSSMIDLIWDTVAYDFGVLCWETQLADNVIRHLFVRGNDNVVSYLTSLEPTLKLETEKIRSAVAALKESLE